ncbi:TIR domain-containing protein [Azotobacter beijerinckii]|uniref:TIR domain-containing protein n=1 Tax=Azotobacter beijerinckii TaxID=170623 RepID=A0A1H9PXL5_9GAMM|nr:toll/interleukin-1 receptor domain-containing protein [Azotobacter beijerinckii]SER52343.1 TIR domain-containing protein [Azotobacter beijerinckii]
MKYQAFISYKHQAVYPFAHRIGAALRRYARPLLRPPVRIFRDEDHLVPDNDLPALIKAALRDSEFLILLASRDAAESRWVKEELRIWCEELRRSDKLIVVLTKDVIAIDPESKRVDWDHTDALPRDVLETHLKYVPLYLDLTWVTHESDLDLQTPRFKQAVNSIVARCRGVDPADMLVLEIREYRRNLRLRNIGVAAITTFAVVATVAGIYAGVQQRSAESAYRASVDELVNATIEFGVSSLRTDPALSLKAALATYDLTDSGRPLELLKVAVKRNPVWTNLIPQDLSRDRPRLLPSYPNPTDPFRPNLDLSAVLMLDRADSTKDLSSIGQRLVLRSVPYGQVQASLLLKANDALISDVQGASEMAVLRHGLGEIWDMSVYHLAEDGFGEPMWTGKAIVDFASTAGMWPLFVLHADGNVRKVFGDSRDPAQGASMHYWNGATRVEAHPAGKAVLLIGGGQARWLSLDNGSISREHSMEWPFESQRYAGAETSNYTKIGWGPRANDLYVLEVKGADRFQTVTLFAVDGLSGSRTILRAYEARVSLKDIVGQILPLLSNRKNTQIPVDAAKFSFTVSNDGHRVALVRPDARYGTQLELFDVDWGRSNNDLQIQVSQHEANMLRWQSPPAKRQTVTAVALSPSGVFAALGTFLKDEDTDGTSLDGIGLLEHWSISELTMKTRVPHFINLVADPISNDVSDAGASAIGMTPVIRLAYSMDGKRLAILHANGVVRLFHVPTEPGYSIPSNWLRRLNPPAVRSFGPFGRYALLRFDQEELRLYDLKDGREVDLSGIGAEFLDIAWVKSTKSLAIATKDGLHVVDGQTVVRKVAFPSQAHKARIGIQLTHVVSDNKAMFFDSSNWSKFGEVELSDGQSGGLIKLLSELPDDSENQSAHALNEWRKEDESYWAILAHNNVLSRFYLHRNISNTVSVAESGRVYEFAADVDWITTRVAGGVMWVNTGIYPRNQTSTTTTVKQFDIVTGANVEKFRAPSGGWPEVVWEIESAFEEGDNVLVIVRYKPKDGSGNSFALAKWKLSGGDCLSWTSLGSAAKSYEDDVALTFGEAGDTFVRLASAGEPSEIEIVRLSDGVTVAHRKQADQFRFYPMFVPASGDGPWRIASEQFFDATYRSASVGDIRFWESLTTVRLPESLSAKLTEARERKRLVTPEQ